MDKLASQHDLTFVRNKAQQSDKPAVNEVLVYLMPFLQRNDLTVGDLAVVAKFIDGAKELIALPNFAALLEKANTVKHCVRCHQDYTDASNGRSACRIEHIFHRNDVETERWVTENGEYRNIWEARCCGTTVESCDEDDPEEPDAPCFLGRHTQLPSEVLKNGVNIIACKFSLDDESSDSESEGEAPECIAQEELDELVNDLFG